VKNGGIVNAQNGCVITIPPNAFVDKNGNAIVGEVTIEFKDVFSNLDMIREGVFPISGGIQLNSGGQFFIAASQNNNNLQVADTVTIKLKIPAQAQDPDMQLFIAGQNPNPDGVDWGNPIKKDTVVLAPGFTVNPNPKDTLGFRPFTPPSSTFTFSTQDNSYEIKLGALGWGNIDQFLSINYFNCEFNLTGVTGLNSSNTNAYAVFKDKNTVWPVGESGWGNISNNLIIERHLGAIPMNILVIAVKNGALYSGVLNVTPQENHPNSIEMKSTTQSELDALVKSLP
jgi:hypothetical protein